MRSRMAPGRVLALLLLLGACSAELGALGTSAAGARSGSAAPIRITFAGSGRIGRDDVRRYITVGAHKACYARETTHEQASMDWRLTWTGVRASARGSLAVRGARLETEQDGATLGDRVRDACDSPGKAPPDWVGSDHCDAHFQALDEGSFSVASGGRNRITIAFSAPRLSLPLNSGCTMTVRNEQFTGHASVSRKTLARLKKGQRLSVPVGISRPGPGDAYEPHFDCSRPHEPYDDYTIEDACSDQLKWSGWLTLAKG